LSRSLLLSRFSDASANPVILPIFFYTFPSLCMNWFPNLRPGVTTGNTFIALTLQTFLTASPCALRTSFSPVKENKVFFDSSNPILVHYLEHGPPIICRFLEVLQK
jgi:hypothetical protein